LERDVPLNGECHGRGQKRSCPIRESPQQGPGISEEYVIKGGTDLSHNPKENVCKNGTKIFLRRKNDNKINNSRIPGVGILKITKMQMAKISTIDLVSNFSGGKQLEEPHKITSSYCL